MKIDIAALFGKLAEEKMSSFNMHEIVQKEFGIPEVNLKTAVAFIGQRLMQKRAEYKTIMEGLAALADLTNSARK